jgi:superfamily I DNA/RNA helicase
MHVKSLYISVFDDEYQDNYQVQSELVLKILTDSRVMVVGGDNQHLYEYRVVRPRLKHLGDFENNLINYHS